MPNKPFKVFAGLAANLTLNDPGYMWMDGNGAVYLSDQNGAVYDLSC